MFFEIINRGLQASCGDPTSDSVCLNDQDKYVLLNIAVLSQKAASADLQVSRYCLLTSLSLDYAEQNSFSGPQTKAIHEKSVATPHRMLHR